MAEDECLVAKEITKASKQMDAPYKDWEQYICHCYSDRIFNRDGEPSHIIMEMCGAETWGLIQPRPGVRNTKVDFIQVRRIVNYMVRGIAYLNMFKPAYIHHDLKPENVCYESFGEKGELGLNVKLIDFGALVQATRKNREEAQLAYTPLYAPPGDGPKGRAWSGEAYSYDIYAAGLIYAQLLCPLVTTRTWYDDTRGVYLHWDPKVVIPRKCPGLRDFVLGLDYDLDLISQMVDLDPDRRPNPFKANKELEDIRDHYCPKKHAC